MIKNNNIKKFKDQKFLINYNIEKNYNSKFNKLNQLLIDTEYLDILYKKLKRDKEKNRIYYYNFSTLEENFFKNFFYLDLFNYYYNNYLENKLYLYK